MEFMNRGPQPAQARVSGGVGTAAPSSGGRKGSHWKDSPMWLRVVWIVLLFSATIVLASMVTLLYLGGSKEADLIQKGAKQAVFLTNGQVYFGEVKSVNNKFMDLREIYYLNVSQPVQPEQKSNDKKQAQNSISLVKLGCELHGPMDQMIINRDQITFWENLKDNGQVAKAIEAWVKQNPNGQKCTTPTPSNSTSQTKQP